MKNKARRGRFELPRCEAPPVFKTGAVGRLAISAARLQTQRKLQHINTIRIYNDFSKKSKKTE